MPLIPYLFFCLIAVGSAPSAAELTPLRGGLVVAVEGIAYHASPSLQRPTLLRGEEAIEYGSVLQTQLHSRIRVLFDTVVLTVGEETRVEIAGSPDNATRPGDLLVSLSRGVIRMVADGGPDRGIRVRIGEASEFIQFSQGALVIWAGESLAPVLDGRPVLRRTVIDSGVANLGRREVFWMSERPRLPVPGGAVLTRRESRQPDITTVASPIAARWIAKTDLGWTAKAESPKERLHSLPTDHHLSLTRQGTVAHQNPDPNVHTPPAVVSGAASLLHAAAGAAKPQVTGPSQQPPSLPPVGAQPPGAPPSGTPIAPAIGGTTPPPPATVPTSFGLSSMSGPSSLFSSTNFQDLAGVIGNGHGKGKR